jgi:hypothetical protein
MLNVKVIPRVVGLGSIDVSQCAYKDPETPAKKPLMTNDVNWCLKTLMPIDFAAIGSSRIALKARP